MQIQALYINLVSKIDFKDLNITLFSLRITPMIWIGGLYQEPLIPDYEEFSTSVLFSL